MSRHFSNCRDSPAAKFEEQYQPNRQVSAAIGAVLEYTRGGSSVDEGRSVRLQFLAIILAGVGCASTPGERAYVISSETSDYSPSVRLAVTVDTTATEILVPVDSGVVRAHGTVRRAGAVMRRLTLEPLLAGVPPRSASSEDRARAWVPLAVAAAVPLADSLEFDQPVTIRRLQWSIPRPENLALSQSWLVFRITGDAITGRVAMADGRITPSQVRVGGVRVFACSDRTLAGTLDRGRAKVQARSYTEAC